MTFLTIVTQLLQYSTFNKFIVRSIPQDIAVFWVTGGGSLQIEQIIVGSALYHTSRLASTS